MTRDGFILVDKTCPVESNTKDELPNMVLVRKLTFSDESDKKLLGTARFSREGVSDLFQIAVKGVIHCRVDFHATANEEGEIVVGNGFGSLGLVKCTMENGIVMRLRRLE